MLNVTPVLVCASDADRGSFSENPPNWNERLARREQSNFHRLSERKQNDNGDGAVQCKAARCLKKGKKKPRSKRQAINRTTEYLGVYRVSHEDIAMSLLSGDNRIEFVFFFFSLVFSMARRNKDYKHSYLNQTYMFRWTIKRTFHFIIFEKYTDNYYIGFILLNMWTYYFHRRDGSVQICSVHENVIAVLFDITSFL